MLTDPELRSRVDQIWDRLWSSGLSNPMDSIEQFSYLLFLKRLDDAEKKREKLATLRQQAFIPQIEPELRWSHWINFKAENALKHLREKVFPFLREMGVEGSSFERYMQNAEFKVSKPSTLIEVCNLIDQMKILEQNQDVQGDLYEYLLSKLSVAVRNGQFRTPRHIIPMMDESDINPTLPTKVKKTELLFLHLILRVLDMGGHCAVIVPDGVLFGSSRSHIEIRKKLIEENRLDGVVSMPSGVFKPYAGVSTAVLLFTRGGTTDLIWFYDMEHDGFSLDDKRQLTPDQNDIPDLLLCWQHRLDTDFTANRATRLAALKQAIAPMKAERLLLQKEINRLMFEAAIAPEDDEEKRQALDTDQQKLTLLHEQMAPLQAEINQLNRQFWVTREQVKGNKYDLSASRYRQVEQDEVYYESPRVTMERLVKLEYEMAAEVAELEKLLEE